MSAEPVGINQPLVDLVAAALNRFGPSLRLIYIRHEPAPGARCVIVFPQPDQTTTQTKGVQTCSP